MGDKTGIEWTDATWNPVTGCTKVSQGCKNCYAERLFPRAYGPRKFTNVRCHPERLDYPLHWRAPRRIFVNSMSDLFHEDIPLAFLQEVWRVMARAHLERGHIFQVLTKRPRRMLESLGPRGFGWYAKEGPVPNPEPGIWLGVSVEDQATADERIPLLLQTPAAVRFVSYEPALAPVNFRHEWLAGLLDDWLNPRPRLDWIIAGGESGPHARPAHPDWFRSVRDQCAAAGVPFFFKQWGEWLPSDQARVVGALLPKHAWYESRQAWRAGKRLAGRFLDGREHSEFPT